MAFVNIIQQFHFLRPWWFLALPPLIYVLLLLHRRKSSVSMWRNLCDSDLLPHILTGQEQARRSWPFWLMLLLLSVAVTSLAGPVWRKLPQPVFRNQSALVIALDLSASMRAGDIPPNRLERAKHKVIDILRRRVDGQTALVVFALEAFTVSPLTEDTNTIALMVPSLSDQLMPSQGSRPELAIAKAQELLKQAAATSGDVLLITDSAEISGMQQAVANLVDAGYRLSILGVGSEEGAPIALQNGGFLKDRTGSIVIPKIDQQALQSLASAGNGVYHLFSSDDADLNDFFRLWTAKVENSDQRLAEQAASKFKADIWVEEGVWLILPLLPFVLLLFRRGWLVVLCVLVLPVSHPAQAKDLTQYFKNNNLNASELYQNKDYEKAAKTFSDPRWKSAAYYKSGDYQKSLDQLRGLDDTQSIYNRGNILARMGKMKDAITAYDEVLKRDPDNEDAKYNRDLLQQYLKQQQQKQNDQSQKDGDSSRQNQQNSQNGEQQQNQSQQDSSEQKDKNSQAQNENDQQQEQQQNQSQQSQQNQADGKKGNSQSDSGENNDEKNNDKDKINPSLAKENQEEQKDQQKDQPQSMQQANQEDANKDQQRSQMQKDIHDQQQKIDQARKDSGKNDAKATETVAKQQLSDKERREMRLLDQWLRRVPDDPGGLLRRKFRYQSQAQGGQVRGVKPW